MHEEKMANYLRLSFLQREEEKYKGKEKMRDMSRQHEGAN